MELPDHTPPAEVGQEITWGPVTAVVVTILGFFAAQIIGGLLLLTIAVVLGHHSLQELQREHSFLEETKYAFAGSFIISLSLFWLTLAFIRQRRGSLKAIGLKMPRAIDVLYALSGFFIYFVAFMAINLIIQSKAPHWLEQNQDVGFSRTAGGLALAPIFVSLVILPPLVEETLFRGFLYSGLRKKLPVVTATIITSAIFASAHLFGGETSALLWAAAIDTLVLSFVLCGLREKTGRLWAPMLVHATKNFIAFAAIFIFKVS